MSTASEIAFSKQLNKIFPSSIVLTLNRYEADADVSCTIEKRKGIVVMLYTQEK